MTRSYVPGLGDKISMAAGRREAEATENVFEAYQRKKKLAKNVTKAQKRRLKRQAQKAAQKELQETLRTAKRRKTGDDDELSMAAERAELALLLGGDDAAGGDDSDDGGASKMAKGRKSRKKRQKEKKAAQKAEEAESAARLLKDDRFKSAILNNPDFAIDSTNQRFKKTAVRVCPSLVRGGCVQRSRAAARCAAPAPPRPLVRSYYPIQAHSRSPTMHVPLLTVSRRWTNFSRSAARLVRKSAAVECDQTAPRTMPAYVQ